MTVEDDDIPARLVNPYRTSGRGPAVWGVTLGRVGAVTAGIVAVIAPSDASTDAPDAAVGADDERHSVVFAGGEILLGTGNEVDNDVAMASGPFSAGYLWAGPPPLDPPASPALQQS